jgi:hypothetical protein
LLVPDAEALTRTHEGGLEPELRIIYGRAERRRMREATQRFAQLGVDVSVVRPSLPVRGAQTRRPPHLSRSA